MQHRFPPLFSMRFIRNLLCAGVPLVGLAVAALATEPPTSLLPVFGKKGWTMQGKGMQGYDIRGWLPGGRGAAQVLCRAEPLRDARVETLQLRVDARIGYHRLGDVLLSQGRCRGLGGYRAGSEEVVRLRRCNSPAGRSVKACKPVG